MLFHPSRLRRLSLAIISLSATVIFSGQAAGVELGAVAVHGSVSATASYSDRYDYLGNTAENASFNSTEFILNGSYRASNGLRFSAQLYAYQLGDYEALTLDFAALDYSFNQQFGLRVGRVKHASGLHGESQDLDMIRPFAYLPFDFYNKKLRPYLASIDGAVVYGNVRAGKSSFDYQLFGGWLPKIDVDSPFISTTSDSAVFSPKSISEVKLYGANLIWNTPAPGLRFGLTGAVVPKVTFSGPTKSSLALSRAINDIRTIPYLFPPGTWDFFAAGQPSSLSADLELIYAFADYTHGDWQFSVEGNSSRVKYTSTAPLFGTTTATTRSDSYYGMITWQASPKLQFGTYYGLAYADVHDRRGRNHVTVPDHLGWLKDFCFATSYNLTPAWIVKGEAHLLNGTKGLGAEGNGDAATWKSNWTYFALKTTFSF